MALFNGSDYPLLNTGLICVVYLLFYFLTLVFLSGYFYLGLLLI